MSYEVHCPNCGEFEVEKLKLPKDCCPNCDSPQVITLGKRWDIDWRFKQEKEMARAEKYRVRP